MGEEGTLELSFARVIPHSVRSSIDFLMFEFILAYK